MRVPSPSPLLPGRTVQLVEFASAGLGHTRVMIRMSYDLAPARRAAGGAEVAQKSQPSRENCAAHWTRRCSIAVYYGKGSLRTTHPVLPPAVQVALLGGGESNIALRAQVRPLRLDLGWDSSHIANAINEVQHSHVLRPLCGLLYGPLHPLGRLLVRRRERRASRRQGTQSPEVSHYQL